MTDDMTDDTTDGHDAEEMDHHRHGVAAARTPSALRYMPTVGVSF